jgi:hypothetical protein
MFLGREGTVLDAPGLKELSTRYYLTASLVQTLSFFDHHQ